MKTISEVTEMLGITRRTLQEYDNKKVDLLHPTNKEAVNNGKLEKWLYDDEAINRLQIITIFREIGYTRKEIKAILDNPESRLIEEFLKGKEKLIEKRRRIEEMTSFLDMFIFFFQLPDYCINYLFCPPSRIKRTDMSVNTILELGRRNINSGKAMLTEDTEPDTTAIMLLLLMSAPQCYLPKSNETQQYIESVLRYCIGKYLDEDGRVTQENRESIIDAFIKENKIPNLIFDDTLSFLNNVEEKDTIEDMLGKGSFRFVEEAINIYKKNKGEDDNGN